MAYPEHRHDAYAARAIRPNWERYVELTETPTDVSDTADVIEKYGTSFEPKRENWEDMHGDIRFDNVSFTYPDGDTEVLSNFSLDVPQGSMTAIVGETGAGKSTLVNLVCRFYEPTAGRVLIDGRDIRERSVMWLHSHIGYVLQTPHLFSGTIRDNLKYGKPDATDEEITAALEAVSALDIVQSLEGGLDSAVGEGGGSLSTGQKQLISLCKGSSCRPRYTHTRRSYGLGGYHHRKEDTVGDKDPYRQAHFLRDSAQALDHRRERI